MQNFETSEAILDFPVHMDIMMSSMRDLEQVILRLTNFLFLRQGRDRNGTGRYRSQIVKINPKFVIPCVHEQLWAFLTRKFFKRIK